MFKVISFDIVIPFNCLAESFRLVQKLEQLGINLFIARYTVSKHTTCSSNLHPVLKSTIHCACVINTCLNYGCIHTSSRGVESNIDCVSNRRVR